MTSLETTFMIDIAWRILDIVIILAGAIAFIHIFSWMVRRMIKLRFRGKSGREIHRRTKTMAPLLNSVIKYIVAFFALIAILREVGVDATALLAGAGVAGIAIGFGAQTLVRDVLTGLFLMFEDSISVGDVVQIGDITGQVEDVGLRVTHIRPFSGALFTIPNGEITRIANFNRGFTRAIVEVGISYEEDVDRTLGVLKALAEDYKKNNSQKVIEFVGIHRIARLDASGVILRLVFKVAPLEHWEVERDMLYLIKKSFDEEKIVISSAQKHVVYIRQETP
ncbi:MAG TPA: mechanosensitive ion channel family protein [Atribacteraceae bacterium]|nr:mechanosensitive ion channel family protein [Atribacteraceae bacterium]